MIRLFTIASLSLVVTCAVAQSTRFQGAWTGTFQATPTVQLSVAAEFNGSAGKWQVSGQNRMNPCLNRDFPLVITNQTDTDLTFEVNGSKLIPGCSDAVISLKVVDDKKLEGAVSDGRQVQLVRK